MHVFTSVSEILIHYYFSLTCCGFIEISVAMNVGVRIKPTAGINTASPCSADFSLSEAKQILLAAAVLRFYGCK